MTTTVAMQLLSLIYDVILTVLELSLPPNKVKKLLITANILIYPETEQVQSLRAKGKTMEEI